MINNNTGMDKILVVEDNRSMREMLCHILGRHQYLVRDAADASTGLLLANRESFSVILSDLQLPDMDGLTLFKRIKSLQVPFIILTAHGSIAKAVEAIKEGAYDFITKPVDPDYLCLIVEKAIASTRIEMENIVLREVLSAEKGKPIIIGSSPPIQEAADKARQVAATDTSVLLTGESGTGKELFARAIHHLSERRTKPFIAINAASIPESLIENELFGHEKGSYTGAYSRQVGKLEMASGGTFFLDEIGDLPLSLQGKILRILEEKKITRLGTSQEIDLDIRFIFASNQNLEQAISQNRFRRDLYYRITAFPIHLPPLRDRTDDILLLADYFCQKFALEMKKVAFTLSERAKSKLRQYAWPGNVRELQNTIERAAILSSSATIGEKEIVLPESPFPLDECLNFQGTLPEVSERVRRIVERKKIEKALEEARYNSSQAARQLGISYKTLLQKIKRYDIRRES